MARPALCISVTLKDRRSLEELLARGVQPVRIVLRCLALLHLADGVVAPEVARFVRNLTPKTVRMIAHRYEDGGLERALYDKPRPGAAPVLSASAKQRVIAMVCSDPPEGYARWTIRLIVEEAIKRKLVPRAGRETIRILLQHHDLQPWREKNVVCRRTDPGIPRKDGRRS